MLPVDAHITFLRVADLDRSHAFYGHGLGLTLVLDQGGCRIYRLTSEAFVGLCKREDAGSHGVIVTIVTDAVDEWYHRMTAAGAEIENSPNDNAEYGIYHFFARDPDGHLLEVQRFWDDRWSESIS